MSPFNPRKDILPPAQRELWMELLPAQGLGFVLYGGTAIALRLGHRTSEDFDFFTERELHKEALSEAFPFITRSTVLQDRSNSFTVQVPFGRFENHYVKVSFFGSISFGRVGEPGITSDGVLQVASLDDLMANKVKVILQRVSAKDYIDIAALLSAGVALDRGLAAAREMFGNAFQPSESLRAMTYFEGGDLYLLTADARETLIRAASAARELPKIQVLSHSLAGHQAELDVSLEEDRPEGNSPDISI
jgi:hypothetical protein